MKARRPPTPPLPRVAQALLIWRRWVPFLRWCHRRYGDVFRIWAPPYGWLNYVARDDDIKAVFNGDADVFHAGDANALLLEPVVGPRSLLVLDEGEHLRDRKLMLPAFHGDRVSRYAEIVEEIAAAEVATWPVGEQFRAQDRTYRIALEAILRAVMGVTDPATQQRLRMMLPRLLGASVLTQAMAVMRLRRIPPARGWFRLLAEVDALLYGEIARRRAEPGDDVLSMLVTARDADGHALDDRALRDELVTLLLAGHETTATALAWAFEQLTRNPRVLERLATELRSGDDRYLDAVVKETLRVRPVIGDVIRRVTADVEIAGYRFPRGSYVLPAIAAVHFAADHWDDPDAFRPERWLDRGGDAYAWIPFGGGRRRCIGAAFAQMEMKAVLRTVLTRVELATTTAPPERITIKHITLVPARGAEVTVRRRLAGPAAAQPARAMSSSGAS